MHSEFISETEQPKEAEQVSVPGHNVLQRLTEATASTRQVILIAYLQEQVAKVIGISPPQLDVQQPLNYMGIDSLIAVKLRNKLRTDLEIDVPAVKFMEDSSVTNLATQLSEQILCEDKENLSPKVMSDDDWLEGEI
jgi:aryl carrier-like protein